MKQSTITVSQREALKKYQNFKHNDDGTCEVRVWLDDDGSINPSSYNLKYRQELENKKKENESPKQDKQSSDSDGEEGLCVKIICSPFLLVWWLIKCILSLVMWPFRIIFSSKCAFLTPRFSFKKF